MKNAEPSEDALSVASFFFGVVVRIALGRLLRSELEHPGAVGGLIAGVQFRGHKQFGSATSSMDLQPAMAPHAAALIGSCVNAALPLQAKTPRALLWALK